MVSVVIDGDWWWLMMIYSDLWWLMVIDGDYWWLTDGDWWWFIVIHSHNDFWWLLVIDSDSWWFHEGNADKTKTQGNPCSLLWNYDLHEVNVTFFCCYIYIVYTMIQQDISAWMGEWWIYINTLAIYGIYEELQYLF